MTVAELIEQLQKLPADLPVYLVDVTHRAVGGVAIVPVVMPPCTHRRGTQTLSLPERVVIGGSSS